MSVRVGEWATTETQFTTYDVQVTQWVDRDELATTDLKPEFSEDAPLTPPDDQQWVIVDLWIRNRGSEPARLGPSQWSMFDLRDIERSPDSEAMRKAQDTLEADETVQPNDAIRPRVIFATASPSNLDFVMEPYGDRGGNVVRVVT